MIRQCLICGGEININPAVVEKQNGGKYCSMKCFGIARRNAPRRKPKKMRFCKYCQKDFFVSPSIIDKRRGLFYSRSCAKKKENNPKWKGGISPIAALLRNNNKYRRWKQQVLIRDNFTCQKCGEQKKNLDVHHKKPFKKLMQEVKKYLPLFSLPEGAFIYTPFWDTNNGVTLCIKCHNFI